MTRSLLSVAILLSGTAMASAAALPAVDGAASMVKTAAVVAPDPGTPGVKPLVQTDTVAVSARETGSNLLRTPGTGTVLSSGTKK